MAWDNNVELLIKKGNDTINEYLKSRNIGPKKMTSNIENKYPGYLHILYYYTIHTHGNNTSFAALCICINQRRRINTELRENLSPTRRMLNEWFVSNVGTKISPLKNPLNTTAHKISRLIWICKYIFYIDLCTRLYCFLGREVLLYDEPYEVLEEFTKDCTQRRRLW